MNLTDFPVYLQITVDYFNHFVILNATYRCIAVIEVKNGLGAGDSVNKCIQMLRNAKVDFEGWFSKSAQEGLNRRTFGHPSL